MSGGPEYVHLAHSLDGYPLCWPMDKVGDHTSTRKESAVTCPECNRLIEEFDE